jgi:hypothetical protein
MILKPSPDSSLCSSGTSSSPRSMECLKQRTKQRLLTSQPTHSVSVRATLPCPPPSTDSGSSVRKPLIAKRLASIAAGKAASILSKVDDRERPRNTFCVGVSWDKYSKEDLLDIVRVRLHLSRSCSH